MTFILCIIVFTIPRLCMGIGGAFKAGNKAIIDLANWSGFAYGEWTKRNGMKRNDRTFREARSPGKG
ncbi:MAG: hypothetical protein LBJ36_02705 [Synergistaceae bacterium]|jgi:hypothetical protein|nr:hypothetical protein [Synergistaceae bacterium]